ncbi:MAG: nucleotide exchange factor GrpE [Clostridia bacterium]|nr:nucleotide exchange factor GrpE [Clostridia bacterium]
MESNENLNEELEENVISDSEELNLEDGQIDKDEYIAKLNDHLNEQKKKADEYFEHLKRNMAEFDNFKKRMSKEKENLYLTITSDVLGDILPVIDTFEKAILAKTKDESYKSGMVMIYNQLNDTLKKFGLEEIECLNQTFDPNYHEAVMHVEDDNYGEKEIIEVLRKGYKIGDKVIRHSMVKVAN